MMVVLLPQANMEAKNPAISISCFLEKSWGTQMGSSLMKAGLLYRSAFSSKKAFNEAGFITGSLPDGLVEIGYEIVHIFYTHTQADKAVAETVFNTFFPRNRSVGHGCGVIDQ